MELNHRNNQINRDLCVKNVQPHTTEEELTELFKHFGTIESIRPFERDPSLAFVRYRSIEEAELAIKSLKFNDLGIRVDFARERLANRDNGSHRRAPTSNGFGRQNETSIIENEQNRCIVCDENGNFECSRCGEIYCTEKCQKNDWSYRQHRRHCFEMPALVPVKQMQNGFSPEINSSLKSDMPSLSSAQSPKIPANKQNHSSADSSEELSSPKRVLFSENQLAGATNRMDYKPKSLKENPVHDEFVRPEAIPLKDNQNVLITSAYFDRMQKRLAVFVRSIDNDQDYKKIIKEVNAYAQSSKPLENDPGMDYVAAPFEDYYYRAAIINIFDGHRHDKLARVGFLDFGNVSTIPLKKLRQLSRQLQLRNRYANKILLKNVPLQIESSDAINYLKKFDDDGIALRVRFQGHYQYLKTPINLYVDTTQDCVNKRYTQFINEPSMIAKSIKENDQHN